jgi:hypothetical protein
MRFSFYAFAAAAVVLTSACQGFETDTRCQFRLDTSEMWYQNGFALYIDEPPPFICPIQLVQFNTRLNYSATAVAPHNKPIGAYTWQIRNALSIVVEGPLSALFGPIESDGTRELQMLGTYPAGSAGFQKVMNDIFHVAGNVEKDFGIYPAFALALFPYKCCPNTTPASFIPVAATSFASVSKSKPTTLRVFRNGSSSGFTTIRWYRNNVEVNVPTNHPWAIGGTRSAYNHTYTAPGTYTWKVVTTYDFPEKTNTLIWTQRVDP